MINAATPHLIACSAALKYTCMGTSCVVSVKGELHQLQHHLQGWGAARGTAAHNASRRPGIHGTGSYARPQTRSTQSSCWASFRRVCGGAQECSSYALP
jgi:hypothetical protein